MESTVVLLLALLAWVRFQRAPGAIRLTCAAALTGLAVVTSYTAGFALPVLLGLMLWAGWRELGLRGVVAGVLGLCAGLCPWFVLRLSGVFGAEPQWAPLLYELPAYDLGPAHVGTLEAVQWLFATVGEHALTFGLPAGLSRGALAAHCLLVVLGGVALVRRAGRPGWDRGIAAALVLLPPCLLLAWVVVAPSLLTWREVVPGELESLRYLVAGVPLIALAAAVGLRTDGPSWLRRGVLATAGLLVVLGVADIGGVVVAGQADPRLLQAPALDLRYGGLVLRSRSLPPAATLHLRLRSPRDVRGWALHRGTSEGLRLVHYAMGHNAWHERIAGTLSAGQFARLAAFLLEPEDELSESFLRGLLRGRSGQPEAFGPLELAAAAAVTFSDRGVLGQQGAESVLAAYSRELAVLRAAELEAVFERITVSSSPSGESARWLVGHAQGYAQVTRPAVPGRLGLPTWRLPADRSPLGTGVARAGYLHGLGRRFGEEAGAQPTGEPAELLKLSREDRRAFCAGWVAGSRWALRHPVRTSCWELPL